MSRRVRWYRVLICLLRENTKTTRLDPYCRKDYSGNGSFFSPLVESLLHFRRKKTTCQKMEDRD